MQQIVGFWNLLSWETGGKIISAGAKNGLDKFLGNRPILEVDYNVQWNNSDAVNFDSHED